VLDGVAGREGRADDCLDDAVGALHDAVGALRNAAGARHGVADALRSADDRVDGANGPSGNAAEHARNAHRPLRSAVEHGDGVVDLPGSVARAAVDATDRGNGAVVGSDSVDFRALTLARRECWKSTPDDGAKCPLAIVV
jgi:hypothetical protein